METNLKNFPVDVNGTTYWISRSCAVTGLVFKKIKDVWYILANKRGQGTPDFQGCWNAPCGYLDWNENGKEAVSRELLEECGFKVKTKKWQEIGTQTEPSANKQNVTIRYMYVVDEDSDEDFDLNLRNGGEEDEVDDVKWISLNEIDNYKWAFNHELLIQAVAIKYLYSIDELIKLFKE